MEISFVIAWDEHGINPVAFQYHTTAMRDRKRRTVATSYKGTLIAEE